MVRLVLLVSTGVYPTDGFVWYIWFGVDARRANVMVDGVEAWAEHEWVGRRVRLGSVVVEITETTIRCPATAVQPSGRDAGIRNMNPPKAIAPLPPPHPYTPSDVRPV